MISIRMATESDAATVTRLVNDAFVVERFFIERDRTNAEEVRRLMSKGVFLLAEDGPVAVGCVYVEVRGERGYFGMLSIEPSRQRTGIGRRLIDTLEEHFRKHGCKFCDLKFTDVRAELHGLYLKLGYRDIGTAEYDDPTPTKIPVRFIIMSKLLS
jgi:GNAT superfamily N-acetyltransferase